VQSSAGAVIPAHGAGIHLTACTGYVVGWMPGTSPGMTRWRTPFASMRSDGTHDHSGLKVVTQRMDGFDLEELRRIARQRRTRSRPSRPERPHGKRDLDDV